MTTKNLICNALFLMTVCSSAFAVSADDRQTFCESHPDKYVWVEGTEACVPINPCLSDNEAIRKRYCVRLFAIGKLSDDKMNLVFDRYSKEALEGTHIDVKKLDEYEGGVYYSIKSSTGAYLVTEASKGADLNWSIANNAFFAYGTSGTWDPYGEEKYGIDKPVFYSFESLDEEKCRDIADFASLLADEMVEYKLSSDQKCLLLIPDLGTVE